LRSPEPLGELGVFVFEGDSGEMDVHFGGLERRVAGSFLEGGRGHSGCCAVGEARVAQVVEWPDVPGDPGTCPRKAERV
jgi:hypothetical protein